mmetsp:Transcript_3716/g.8104  ORF Transcript_3716/g.8104 Transcript_3716/m.8104 type:complete len:249 (-) Transcript_3716:19-765(-)
MEKRDDSTFEFSSSTGVDGCGTESLPDDSFTNVSGNENRNTRSKTISLLQELVEGEDNQTGAEKLEDNQNRVTRTNRTEISVHSAGDVSDGFTECDQKTEEFLGTRKQSTIFLHVVVNLDDSRTGQKLHDQTGCNDRTDTEFHQSTAVGSKDDTHPIERVTRLGRLDTVDRDLTAYQENEEDNGRPKKLFAEGNLAVRGLNLGEDRHDGTDQMKESHGYKSTRFCCKHNITDDKRFCDQGENTDTPNG